MTAFRDIHHVRSVLERRGVRPDVYAVDGFVFPCPVCGDGWKASARPLAGGGVIVGCNGCSNPGAITDILLDLRVTADDGLADVLDAVRTFVTSYVVVTTDQAVAVTLWIAHTYAIDAADQTPYLAITSPEKRSGKSRLLDVLQELVHQPWRAVLPSEAVVFRQVAKVRPTLLLDEVDAIWGKRTAAEHEGLRALLNAGWRRRGSTVPRCQPPSMTVVDFSTFCAKAIAGIGDLPDTIADRSIAIRMERKRRTDNVRRFRERDITPIAAHLRETIQTRMQSLTDALTAARPVLPDELDDRAQDGWEPLLAIADAAGTEWATAARRAALNLTAGRSTDDGVEHQLLSDLRTVFETTGADQLNTGELIEHLCEIPDSPWSDWNGRGVTGRRIARWLRTYGIKARHSGGFRGYVAADFTDAFARYLPETVRSVQTRTVEPKTVNPEVSDAARYGQIETGRDPATRAEMDTSDSSQAGSEQPTPHERLLHAIETLHAEGLRGHDLAADWRRGESLEPTDPALTALVDRLEVWAAS